MRKIILVLSLALFSFEIQAVPIEMSCKDAPDCTSLGYTKTASECPKGSAKCPWNTSLVYCKDIIKVGDILYSDMTTSSEIISGKTALGVIVYVDASGEHGQAMSAWPVDKNGNKSNSNVYMIWETIYNSTYYDIDALPNYSSEAAAAQDFNSCSNTDKILADTRTTYPAAQAARAYAPTAETKGKWCLPAAGIMTSIYNNQNAVQAGISKLGGVSYPGCCGWSSSEQNHRYAWGYNIAYSFGLDTSNNMDKNVTKVVYPVLEF